VSPPTLRRIGSAALLALLLGLGVASLWLGGSSSYLLRLVQRLAIVALGVVIVGAVVVLLMQRLAGWRQPASEREFDALVERSERLAADGSWGEADDLDDFEDDDEEDGFDPHSEEDFQALVRSRSTTCRSSSTARSSTSPSWSPTAAAGAAPTASTTEAPSRATASLTGS